MLSRVGRVLRENTAGHSLHRNCLPSPRAICAVPRAAWVGAPKRHPTLCLFSRPQTSDRSVAQTRRLLRPRGSGRLLWRLALAISLGSNGHNHRGAFGLRAGAESGDRGFAPADTGPWPPTRQRPHHADMRHDSHGAQPLRDSSCAPRLRPGCPRPVTGPRPDGLATGRVSTGRGRRVATRRVDRGWRCRLAANQQCPSRPLTAPRRQRDYMHAAAPEDRDLPLPSAGAAVGPGPGRAGCPPRTSGAYNLSSGGPGASG